MEGTEVEVLIKALNRIAEALEKGFVPLELTVVGIGVPIFLTLGSLWLNYRTSKQNEELQNNLHNRDVKNQTRQIIINIYNSYLDALSVAEMAENNFMIIFISPQFIQSWSGLFSNSCSPVVRAFSQANIILNDSDMIDYLSKCKEAFVALNNSVNQYTNTPTPFQIIQNAWNTLWQKYPQRYQCMNTGSYVGMNYGNSFYQDYNLLHQNPADLEEFKKLCETDYTKNIQEKLKMFLGLVRDGQFDNYFKKYVQIQKM